MPPLRDRSDLSLASVNTPDITPIEEELHEKAHIDYTTVAIVSPPNYQPRRLACDHMCEWRRAGLTV